MMMAMVVTGDGGDDDGGDDDGDYGDGPLVLMVLWWL